MYVPEQEGNDVAQGKGKYMFKSPHKWKRGPRR